MGSTIFQGSSVKALKDIFKIGEGARLITNDSDDPRVVAKDAEPGSLYIRTNGQKFRKIDSGSSTNWVLDGSEFGPKNYFDSLDSDIEGGVAATGWDTDDGAGGAALGLTLDDTSLAGELLAGGLSLKLTKDAANRSGEFIKVRSLTIDPCDRGKANFGSFQFRAGSGYVGGDLIWEVYDVTNAAVLYSGVAEDTELLSSLYRFDWTTYLEDTTAQVEFRVKVNNTNANGYDVFFDEFTFGPAPVLSPNIITEWESYSPSTTALGATSDAQAEWRRVGDSMEVSMQLIFSASGSAGNAGISIPAGYTMDTTKIPGSMVGIASRFDASTGQELTGYAAYGSSTFLVIVPHNEGGNFLQGTEVDAGDYMRIKATVPITGWDSGATMISNQFSQQTVLVSAQDSGNQPITADVTDIPFDSEQKDNTNSWNGSQFTSPKTGRFSFDGMVRMTATGNRGIYLYNVTDSLLVRFFTTTPAASTIHPFSGQADLIKGKVYSIRSDVGGTLTTGVASSHWISITSQPDYTTLGVVNNSKYLEVILSTNTTNSSTPTPYTINTYRDIVGAALSLEEGEWDIGFAMPMFWGYVAGSSIGVSAGIDIADGSNNHLAGSEAYAYQVMSNGDDNVAHYLVNKIRVNVSQAQVYKARMRCNQLDTAALLTVDITSTYGDGIFWARKVK